MHNGYCGGHCSRIFSDLHYEHDSNVGYRKMDDTLVILLVLCCSMGVLLAYVLHKCKKQNTQGENPQSGIGDHGDESRFTNRGSDDGR